MTLDLRTLHVLMVLITKPIKRECSSTVMFYCLVCILRHCILRMVTSQLTRNNPVMLKILAVPLACIDYLDIFRIRSDCENEVRQAFSLYCHLKPDRVPPPKPRLFLPWDKGIFEYANVKAHLL